MKKFDGTITLALLEQDNDKRVIFRLFPLCTKDGLIFQNRKASYPDYGSLRIIPDKREQSSFKDRMREMGNFCCVYLMNDGKELTKIRQNRNYDPNKEECNQYAIYSDIVCGFQEDSVFEVYQEDQQYTEALTQAVLVQRGKVLFGPVDKGESPQWEDVKPFGNEEFLMHTVEDLDGKQRTFYWNPEAFVTWRDRKKLLKRMQQQEAPAVKEDQTETSKLTMQPQPESESELESEQIVHEEKIPIGTKLEILDESLSNQEQITGLNQPVSDDANRLETGTKQRPRQEKKETPRFHSTPIANGSNYAKPLNHPNGTVHHEVERQIHQNHFKAVSDSGERKTVENPIEAFRTALQDAWSIPALHDSLIRLLCENKQITQAMIDSSHCNCQSKIAYSAAKAQLDYIEGERISMLVELDKVKVEYQRTREKMYHELTKQRHDEIEAIEKRLSELNLQQKEMEATLAELGDKLNDETTQLLSAKTTVDVTSNGSDLIITPRIGVNMEPRELIEMVRTLMNDAGFLCKQDCVTEFLVLLSLYDTICVQGKTISTAEHYVKHMIRTLGLTNVTAWPSVFGTVHIVSLMPDSDQQAPTIEVQKNKRTPIAVFGHKTIRLIDEEHMHEAENIPIMRVPLYNFERNHENIKNYGKPVALHTLNQFSHNIKALHKEGEDWFDALEKKIADAGLEITKEILLKTRFFARAAAPYLVGGFAEAADAAVLAWIVPILQAGSFNEDVIETLVGELPRCYKVMLNGADCY